MKKYIRLYSCGQMERCLADGNPVSCGDCPTWHKRRERITWDKLHPTGALRVIFGK